MGLAEQLAGAVKAAFRSLGHPKPERQRRRARPQPRKRKPSPRRRRAIRADAPEPTPEARTAVPAPTPAPAPAAILDEAPPQDIAAEPGAPEPRRRRRSKTHDEDAVEDAYEAEGAAPVSRYLSDMGREPPLYRPAEELAAARAIRAMELALWSEMLGFRPCAVQVAAAAVGVLSEPPASLTKLAASRKGTKADASAAAEAAKASDPERDAMRAALAAAREAVSAALAAKPKKKSAGAVKRAKAAEAAGRDFLQRLDVAERALTAAKHEFVRRNLRYAVSLARKISARRSGLAFADVIQEANLGLMRALDGFDPERGFRFTTYATWWIRQQIGRSYDDDSRTVRLPVHLQDAHRKAWAAAGKLRSELGREPEAEEVARRAGLTRKALDRAVLAHRSPLALDAPVPGSQDGDKSRSLMETVADEVEGPEEAMVRDESAVRAAEALSSLPESYARVLRMRFGIGTASGEPMTLDEIGGVIGRTRERVRQIQVRGLSLLRRALAKDGLGAAAPRARLAPPPPDAPNLIGHRFGILTVAARAGRSRWACRCDCGGGRVLHTSELDGARSCGCTVGRPGKIEPPLRAGQKIRGLLVLGPADDGVGGEAWDRWRIRCSCKAELVMNLVKILRGSPCGRCSGAATAERARARAKAAARQAA